MSAYDWPAQRNAPQNEDDPTTRQRHVSRLRPQFDLDGALRAGRRTAPQGSRHARERARRAGVVFAPATGVRNLWQPLGPMTVVDGQTVGANRVSGRVRALAVDADGERLYAAAANGGIWYSDDAGGSWRSIGGFAPTDLPSITRPAHRHACGAILVHFDTGTPPDPARDEVIVGTGERIPFPAASPGGRLGGVGILTATGPATSGVPDPWQREAPELTGRGVNRLAAEPVGTRVVAATSIGLFERPAAPSAGGAWARVASPPFDALEAECTDVLWTAGVGVRPARLWVWVRGGESGGLWVQPKGAARFARVTVRGAHANRSVLAAADPPDTVYLFNDRYSEDASKNKDPGLFRIDASGAGTPSVKEVEGVPDLLGSAGHYDMAIAVHPTNPARVVLGGADAEDVLNPSVPGLPFGPDVAAIHLGEVGLDGRKLTFGHPAPPIVIGVGAHADVHDLRYARGGARLFTGCDGGVFRSDHPDQQVGFVACNDGLAVVESNYVASHPTCEGHVVAGLQDNGIIERRSGPVWKHTGRGDAGGVAFDPVTPTRYVRQYRKAFWVASAAGGFGSLLSHGGSAHPKADKEWEASAFYSMPAAIAHARGAPPVDVTQVLLGTDRPWYTEDWGGTWVTLPTGKDPIKKSTYRRSQDQLDEGILVCRWASPDVAWLLCEGLVVRLSRTPGSADAGGPGEWAPARQLLRREAKPKKDETSAAGPMRAAQAWTDLAVDPTVPPDAGPDGAVYVGTTGHPDDTAVDTLWWYDGTDTWHPTGLRAEAVPAAVTAVLCDPTHPEHVYAGTTVGVWRGTRVLAAGQPPDWVWDALVNGLPEAAVEDLSLFEPGGLRLLRAAIAARGVWELEIDADVAELTYVRAHRDDLRRRLKAVETQRDTKTPRSWHGSPDVRPRLTPVPIPRPATLPWDRNTSPLPAGVLRRFQAALRSLSSDPRVRATDQWGLYFEEILRDLGATVDAFGDVVLDEATWDAAMVAPHDSAEPWGAAPPSEADLYDFTPELVEGDATGTSCQLAPELMKVDVVVHHRGLAPRDGADVRVTLLHWIDPRKTRRAKHDDASTWFTGDVPWTEAVNDVLNSAGGTTSRTFGDGWHFTGPAGGLRQTLAGQTLDAGRSGIATFDIDLRGAHPNLVVLLVAVVRAGADLALTPRHLPDLALEHPGVAVRSMQVQA
jgi:hypothetical protein